MSFSSNTNVDARPVGVDMTAVMRQVYLWMTLGLAVSAITAYSVASSGLALAFSTNPILVIVMLIVYIGLAFTLQPIIMRSTPAVGSICFLAFTAMLGLLISSIFLIYNISTIGSAFLVTTATFATVSVIGYTTKRDLSGMGSILTMAVIGLIIASVVNIFLANSLVDSLISYAGVLIFVGLTAYDTQWIKNYAGTVAGSGNSDMIQRVSLIGAFHLYMDFVNLFMFILRIMGGGGRGGRR